MKYRATFWKKGIKAFTLCCSVAALGTVVVAKTLAHSAEDAALQNAAIRYQQCFEKQDSACLYAFSSSAERKKLGLTEAKFGKFASGILWPALRGIKPQGAARRFATEGEQNLVATGDTRVVYAEKAGPKHIVVIQRYKNSAGQTDTLKFELANTANGVKSTSLVGGLYLTSISAFAPKDQVRQWKRYGYWSSWTKAHLAQLKNSGVRGYVADAFSTALSPVNWDEWIRYWDAGNDARNGIVPPVTNVPTRSGGL